MNKILAIVCAISLSGCSLIWHNTDYPVHGNIGQCPAENWPYIFDTLATVAFLSAGSIVWSGIVDVKDRKPYTFLFLVGAAFGTSVIGGAGEVVGCERRIKNGR